MSKDGERGLLLLLATSSLPAHNPWDIFSEVLYSLPVSPVTQEINYDLDVLYTPTSMYDVFYNEQHHHGPHTYLNEIHTKPYFMLWYKQPIYYSLTGCSPKFHLDFFNKEYDIKGDRLSCWTKLDNGCKELPNAFGQIQQLTHYEWTVQSEVISYMNYCIMSRYSDVSLGSGYNKVLVNELNVEPFGDMFIRASCEREERSIINNPLNEE